MFLSRSLFLTRAFFFFKSLTNPPPYITLTFTLRLYSILLLLLLLTRSVTSSEINMAAWQRKSVVTMNHRRLIFEGLFFF